MKIEVDIDKRLPEAFRVFTGRLVEWYCSFYMPLVEHRLEVGVLVDEKEREVLDENGEVAGIDAGYFTAPGKVEFEYGFLHKDLPLFIHVLFHEMSHYRLHREGKVIEDSEVKYEVMDIVRELKGLPEEKPHVRHGRTLEEKYCNDTAREAMKKFFIGNQPLVKWLIKEHSRYTLTKGVTYLPFKDTCSSSPKLWKVL